MFLRCERQCFSFYESFRKMNTGLILTLTIRKIFYLRWLFLLIVLLNYDETVSQDVCSAKATCSDCITAGLECVWWKKEDMNITNNKRCLNINTNIFKANEIVNPQPNITYNKHRPLSEPKVKLKAEDIVQLYPQEVSLKMRINSPQKFTVQFRQAEDYPVDLYFLMDLSNSMADDKTKLADLGHLLGTTMENITKNFLLGFGSFVDKRIAPYVSILPSALISPCRGCAAPYGFKNHMPLSDDTQNFVEQVKKSNISSNLDTPEGGFDAMMQVIVCDKAINWRNISRKIILVATDAGFHFAGDGRLGGVVIPNDETCRLDQHGVYTKSTTTDYPSISQINRKVIEKDINVIFAATKYAYYIYDDLRKVIQGSSTGLLDDNSDNIVDLVYQEYQQLTSNVKLTDTAPSNVLVSYYSKCLKGQKRQTNSCHDFKVGDLIEFSVMVEVKQCPAKVSDRKISFEISPIGLSEKLKVNLDLYCDCDCEQKPHSNNCSRVGTYECGVCTCPENKFGQFCQCDNEQAENSDLDDERCKENAQALTCSGRGTCKCGQCSCHQPKDPEKKIDGAFCQCDNFLCKNSKDGLLCGGFEHGICDCGKCICRSGWTGDDCKCKATNESCIGTDGIVCSKVGNCVCGECDCPLEYDGNQCQEKINPAGRCVYFRECVQCLVMKEMNPSLNCSNCGNDYVIVEELKAEDKNEYRCSFNDDEGCQFSFIYGKSGIGSGENIKIRVWEKRECPKPPNIPLIVAAVITSVVAIGLGLLLIWKIVTTIYDRREYNRFMQNCSKAKWEKSDNPIYKQPKSNFANPMYTGDCN